MKFSGVNRFVHIKKTFIAMVSTLLFFSGMGQTMAEHNNGQVDLETIAERAEVMQQLIEKGKLEEAKKLYDWTAEHFPSINFREYDLNVEQMTELLRSFERMRGSVTSVDMSEEIRLQYIMAFRLAVDAVISKENQLWRKYAERSLLTIEAIEDYLMQGQKEAALQAFYQWQREFEMLRPAIYISEGEKYLPFDAYVRHLVDNTEWIEKENTKELTKLKENFIQVIQGKYEHSAVDPSMWLIMLTIGGVIILSLSYTGWKKYKGEKNRQQLRD